MKTPKRKREEYKNVDSLESTAKKAKRLNEEAKKTPENKLFVPAEILDSVCQEVENQTTLKTP